jgi:hypothetical protein
LGLEFVLCIAALLLAYHLGTRYVINYRLTGHTGTRRRESRGRLQRQLFLGAQTPMFRAFKTALQVINIYRP